MNTGDRNDKIHDDTTSRGDAAEHVAAEDLKARLAEAEKREDENLRLAQRCQADLINYRRRVEQEKEELSSLAKAQLALKILPVLDDFNLALSNPPSSPGANGSARPDGWVQGIELIHRKLVNALLAEGITRIEAEGREFDPWEHEAVLHVPSDQHPEGTVIEVLRDGYKMGKRVIRPAQVKVSKG